MTNTIFRKSCEYMAIFAFFVFIPSAVNAIVLSPAKQTIVIKPGKSELAKIEITNNTESTKIYSIELDGFKLDEKTGSPVFGHREDAIGWITVSKKEITLKPGEKKINGFTITAPKNASPSGHYIALFAKEKNSGGQISLNSRVGSLLYLYIEGMIREELFLISFTPENKIFEKESAKLFLNLKNKGNIHVIPDGEIEIRNWMNKAVAKMNLNDLQRKVLPDGSWIAEYAVPLKFSLSNIGFFKAKCAITYGLTKQKIYAETTFWLLPVKILVYFFELCILSALVWLFIKKYLKK